MCHRQTTWLNSHRLSQSSSDAFWVLVLSRNPSSNAAKALNAENHVQVVQGDKILSGGSPTMLARKERFWGVFTMASPGLGQNMDVEAQQAMADRHSRMVYPFSFTSLQRDKETSLIHVQKTWALAHSGKVEIEPSGISRLLVNVKLSCVQPSSWVLRSKMITPILAVGLRPDNKVQLTVESSQAVSDIGDITTTVFKDPKPSANKVLALSGDGLTVAEQDGAYPNFRWTTFAKLAKQHEGPGKAINEHDEGWRFRCGVC